MKPRVYVETSIISYLTALPSRDIVTAAHQQLTQEWWGSRDDFELYSSQVVLDEIRLGDSEAAARRLVALGQIPLLDVNDPVREIARSLLSSGAMPAKAATDALHVAVAAVHGMNYLLTWNCSHIANAAIRPRIEETCRLADLQPPIICTPEELQGEPTP